MPKVRRRFINRWLTWIVMGIVLSAFWILFMQPRGTVFTSYDPDSGTGTEQVVVGVLDFEAQNVDVTNAEAISDRLHIYMARTEGIEVISKHQIDVLVDEGGPLSPTEIGDMLGADLMVTGTISHVGSLYSLKAAVIRVSDGKVVGQAFQDVTSLERLLTDATQQIANSLAPILQNTR